jgi:CHAD domain-containing protein
VSVSPEPHVPTEREVKLGAAPSFRLPDLTGVADGIEVEVEPPARLDTTYYDTAELHLARWGLSLRYRRGEGWTLKLPAAAAAGAGVLARSELVFPAPARRPPDAAVALVRAYVRGRPLEPVARLSTVRRKVRLVGEDGRELAEVVDDEVSVLDGRRVAGRFREVEVELREGGDVILEAVLRRLREAGAGAPDPTPKLVRALGPAAQAAPEVAVTPLPPEPAAADVVRNAVAAGVELIMRHDPLIRLGRGDPEDVHQARVGTRRLRSNLRTFRPLLDAAWTDSLRDELGWLGGELGAVRDAEVLLERLQARIERLPADDARPAAGILAKLAAAIEAARQELLRAMSSQRYIDLLERLVEAAARPAPNEASQLPSAPAAEVLPPLAHKPWKRLRTAVRELPDEPRDEQLHGIRILAKRARYAAEAVAPAVGREASRYAKLVAALQTVLGEHQDSVTAQGWLRGSVRARRGAFVAGELCMLELEAAEMARRAWPKAWSDLNHRRLREWMRTPRALAS